MAREDSADEKLEIGHVLFIDLVGYSKLLIEEQKERLSRLTSIVLETAQVRESTDEQLVRLPTGDGMALVFHQSVAEPARCALEIAEALRKHPETRVRMGIHSGPVCQVTDVSGRSNIAGAGINMAQRVMDCGDAGHIITSQRVAEDLEQYRQWRSLLHELGEVQVKHCVRLRVFNLHNEELGNPELPEKLRMTKSGTEPETVRADEGFWVAVLPFKYSGGNSDLIALVEGLTEEIVTGLSRFSYLKVIARGSTACYATDSVDVRAAGKELGARYVMEGSLRQAGTRLRLTVQLVDAATGAHLWAETYERTFRSDEIFDLQDDLVPRIVSTVADHHGVLARSMSQFLRSKASDQLSPYEAVLRSFGYYDCVTPDEHAAVRVGLERATQQLPGYADGWAMLSIIYTDEYKYGFNAGPDPLGRALEAARRATDAAPSNHFAYLALAQTLFFRKEF
jgi:TolB-like protein